MSFYSSLIYATSRMRLILHFSCRPELKVRQRTIIILYTVMGQIKTLSFGNSIIKAGVRARMITPHSLFYNTYTAKYYKYFLFQSDLKEKCQVTKNSSCPISFTVVSVNGVGFHHIINIMFNSKSLTMKGVRKGEFLINPTFLVVAFVFNLCEKVT